MTRVETPKAKTKIKKLNDCIGKELKVEIQSAKPKQIFLLENLRFYKEEEENDFTFAHSLANLADIYVNDAFAVSHRNHASVSAITNFLPAVAGFLMETEVTQLSKTFSNVHPTIWLMGGAKLDKIDLINQALQRADYLLIGGALAFTFLKAQRINIGMSKFDSNSLELAQKLLNKYKHKIILPVDFIVSEEFKVRAKTSIVKHNQIKNNQIALDIGPETAHNFQQYLIPAKLIVWNGPLGYFEWAKFAKGTKEIARFLGKLNAIKISGGGETTAAIHKFGLEHNLTHLSTGGGASLEFLSGKKLPGIEALEENCKKFNSLI
ncbi:MAG: phosphoglycerate kinase [Nanoarchaeota archaeon]